MIFKPCNGQCTDEGSHCEGCGRSHEEIAEMRDLVGGLVEFSRRMNYENTDDFALGVANTVRFKLGDGH